MFKCKRAPLQHPAARRQLFDQFLRCLDREEDLIHYRLSWGLQCNAALFAGVFALYTLKLNDKDVNFWALTGIAAFGFLVSVLSSIGVRAGHRQSDYLINELTRRLGVYRDSDSDWSETEFMRPFGGWKVHKAARYISASLPFMFCFLWFAVFIWADRKYDAERAAAAKADRNSIREQNGPLTPDLALLTQRIGELGKTADTVAERLRMIEDNLKPPAVKYPASEAALTKDQRTAIQQRLVDLGFKPKGVDGIFGSDTRIAVRTFQRSDGEPATGHLTAAQIERLLGTRVAPNAVGQGPDSILLGQRVSTTFADEFVIDFTRACPYLGRPDERPVFVAQAAKARTTLDENQRFCQPWCVACAG